MQKQKPWSVERLEIAVWNTPPNPRKNWQSQLKISSEKESKFNGWRKKKIYQFLGRKTHQIEEDMKSPLEFSTAPLWDSLPKKF